ncbi:MAG: putative DNA binding domain-containing protein, partial [Pontiellaceae bacterium]|nr:putative DNA binding domain-containing protein [Pontiellaceae bacterium]
MTQAELKKIIVKGESENVEFKRSFGRECIETVCAFANSSGGRLLVGVTNAGEICGAELSPETLQDWCNQIKMQTSPAVIPDIEVLETESGPVAVIDVDEYPVKPVNSRGRYFKRVQNSNHQMDSSEVANMYLATFNLSWDAYEYPNASLDQLDKRKIRAFIARVNGTKRFALKGDPVSALRKLHLIRENNKPTGAALLLFAKNPLPFRIHIGRFKTPSMIIDDKQVEDTLFEAVEAAMKILIGHIHVAFEFDGSIQRKERFQYSLEAIRETLLNAVVHRDYTNPGDIIIKVFDDRIPGLAEVVLPAVRRVLAGRDEAVPAGSDAQA